MSIQENSFEAQYAETAELLISVMRQNSELGTLITFLQDSNTCKDFEHLCRLLVDLLSDLGLESVAELRVTNKLVACGAGGRALSKAEAEIMENARHKDRLITHERLAIVNYPNLTLLVKNMPVQDEARYGQAKDLVVQVSDLAQARVRALSFETTVLEQGERATAIIDLVQQKSSDNLNHMHTIMGKLLQEAEASLNHLGCTDEQERFFLGLIESASRKLDDLNDANVMLERHLMRLMLGLHKSLASAGKAA